MKRFLLLLLLCPAVFSCNKVLDKKASDFVEPGNYYNSESDLNLALTAVYDIIGNEYLYTSSLWYQLGICTDEAFYAFSSNSYSAPMFYQFDYTNVYIQGLWQQCYVGIERANLLLANIHKPVMDETKRQAIYGEALFLRAFYHFLLVSNYGHVPLKLEPSADVNSVNGCTHQRGVRKDTGRYERGRIQGKHHHSHRPFKPCFQNGYPGHPGQGMPVYGGLSTAGSVKI
jgi:hypothetical protein